MLLRDVYETKFGIYNHLEPTASKRRPLGSVAFHEPEEINDNSLLKAVIKRYMDNSVGEYTKLSLLEFMELPSDIVDIVIELCQAKSKAVGALVSGVENDLNKITSK